MKPIRVLLLLSACLLLLIACAPEDPVQEILEERARWSVQLTSFAEREEDGTLVAQFNLSGPVYGKLQHLTVRVDRIDAQGEVIGSSWETFHVGEIERGTPTTMTLTLPASEVSVESLVMDPVLKPSEEDRAHIKELARAGS